jgi:hypothetical protein
MTASPAPQSGGRAVLGAGRTECPFRVAMLAIGAAQNDAAVSSQLEHRTGDMRRAANRRADPERPQRDEGAGVRSWTASQNGADPIFPISYSFLGVVSNDRGAMSVEVGGGLTAETRSEEVALSITFPGESAEYRVARDELLEQEVELRRAMERVAAKRRALPPAGVVPCEERRSQQRRDPEGTEAGRHPQVRRARQRPQVRVVDQGSEPAASVDDRQGRGRSADRIGHRGGQLHLGGGTEPEVRGRLTTFSASTRSIYAGLAPKLRLIPPPSQDCPGRQITTCAAHLVVGATLGWLLGLGPTD